MMLRTTLRAVGDLAVTLGALTLLFVVWQGWWTDVQANAQAEDLLVQVRGELDDPPQALPDQRAARDRAPERVVEPPASSIVHDQAIGVVHLPTIGEVRVVKEGTSPDVLNEGVLGHYPGTGAPGAVGNFAVAGHRTTYGRPLWHLEELKDGDPIVVETEGGYHVYRIEGLEVVEPTRWQVLAPVPGDPEASASVASMVLTACHPKFSAEERLVAHAVLERSVPRDQGPPPEIRADNRTGRR
ncbi:MULTISPECIES: class E sortase [unclassified Ornithinimicrobium]|uniref:class E sortase n=1 Tax=unclassified Ornithinimicrobium TaxID=2615080 RepID=UPI003852904A